MINNKEKLVATIALYLAGLALEGQTMPEERFKQVDLEPVFEYAKKAGIGAITYCAIEHLIDESQKMNTPYLSQWEKVRLDMSGRTLLYDEEVKRIFAFCNKNQIWYLPLKGYEIKKLYPQDEMREMSDVDILIDPEGRDALGNYLLKNKYKRIEEAGGGVKKIKPETDIIEDGGEKNSDDFYKKPFLQFEIHRILMEKRFSPVQAEYYSKIENLLIRDAENPYHCHLKDEDFYIYMVVHAYKHFKLMGIGVRFLMDFFVFLKAKMDTMDMEYIEETCETLEIASFEKDIREVSLMAFDINHNYQMNQLTVSQNKLYESCLIAGTYGNETSRWKNQMYEMNAEEPATKKYRRHYYFKRLFPGDDWYRTFHPVVYRYKFLKPFFVIYRMTVLLFRGRKHIINEMKEIEDSIDK